MTPFEKRTPLQRLMYLGGVVKAVSGKAVEDTATGNPVTFETDLAKPLKSLVANFLPIQSGTGDPSPTNIRPITGWTGVDVWHGGKNLFSTTLEQGAISATNGNDSGSDARVRCVGFIHLSAGKYTVSAVGVGQAFFYVYDTNGQYIQSESSAGFANIPRTLTLVGDRYVRVAFRVSSNNENVTPSDVSNVQLEVGSSATTYEAQNITKYPVTWSTHGTIYGGYVDLVTGEVWGTWAGIDKKWSEGENATDIGSGITRKAFNMVDNLQTGNAKNKCNVAPYSANENAEIHFYYSGSGATNRKARVFLPTETDGDTDIVIITNVSVPILITTITPQQINALIGNNTIWSDGNWDCSVTFLKKG